MGAVLGLLAEDIVSLVQSECFPYVLACSVTTQEKKLQTDAQFSREDLYAQKNL